MTAPKRRWLQLVLALAIIGLLLFVGRQAFRPRPPLAGLAPQPPLALSGPVPTPAVLPATQYVPTPRIFGAQATPTLAAAPTPAGERVRAIAGQAAARRATTGTGGWPRVAAWPTASATPVSTATPIPPTPALAPPEARPVNGVAYERIVVMPPEVVARVRAIYAAGLALGRNPNAYSKVGDSTVENPHFMARFDEGGYNLGDYAPLQAVVDQFRGSHARDSIAVRIGLHAWTANDPAWADPGVCLPNETPVACELRVHNPSVLLIRLGTNDVGVPDMFAANIRHILDTAIAAGVIPVIGTKGDFHEGSDENNTILRALAAEYQVPLWDYSAVAATLPGRGLDQDAAHMMTFYSHDYTDPTAFTRGHAMHNLTALLVLDAVWRLREGG